MYGHEMTEAEHIELLDVILKHRGPAVLSGYDNDLYNSALAEWDQVVVKPQKLRKRLYVLRSYG